LILPRPLSDILCAGFGYTFDALASAAPSASSSHHPFFGSVISSSPTSSPLPKESAPPLRRRLRRRTSEEEHFPPSQPFSPLSATFSRSPKSPKSPKSARSGPRRRATFPKSPGSPFFRTDGGASAKAQDAEDQDAEQDEDGEDVHENELARAFGIIFSTARKFRAITILQVWFPFLRRFVSDRSLAIPSSHSSSRMVSLRG
jgi:hypothetical protein